MKVFFAKILSFGFDHLDFVKKAFSDNGQPSSSRLLSIPHSAAAIFALLYVVIHTHQLPDGTATAGLGAFATAPYAVNRVSNMFQKKDDQKEDQKDA